MTFKRLDKVARDGFDNVWTIVGYNGHSGKCVMIADAEGGFSEVAEDELTYIYSEKTAIKYDSLAMYVIVKNTAPIGLGINACTHAGYLAAKKFKGEIHTDWEKHSFRKRTCLVSEEEYNECIKSIIALNGDYLEFIENDWGDRALSAAFAPRYSFPSIFKKIKLHPGFVL
jgi:hypothetical protein